MSYRYVKSTEGGVVCAAFLCSKSPRQQWGVDVDMCGESAIELWNWTTRDPSESVIPNAGAQNLKLVGN